MEPADEQRQKAIERLKNKRAFTEHVVSYIVVNGFLVIVWAMTGAGYFWPAWVMVGWGVGLVFHAWTVFGQKPITESDIQQEMRKGEDGTV